ncbi:hypothetical protein I4F81_004060 [Pyropia yezoensis]|uniref:Uncharacterized protein n=1 Tax=Pyropia yezoensis TaxID=2788 RepID=A0ACC3BUW6_PYRYE|nr:hypothetical protein I4F81_004060 [Neopyropia yezoensis]
MQVRTALMTRRRVGGPAAMEATSESRRMSMWIAAPRARPSRLSMMVALSALPALLTLLRPHRRPRSRSGTLPWGSFANSSQGRCAPRLSARRGARRTLMCAKRW